MKAVLIVHNSAIDVEVNEALESLGIDCYTKFPQVLGKGRLSEPHLGTDVWPGTNTATFVVVESEKVAAILQTVAQMRQRLGREGVKAFVWTIEQLC